MRIRAITAALAGILAFSVLGAPAALAAESDGGTTISCATHNPPMFAVPPDPYATHNPPTCAVPPDPYFAS
jgi:hypothetical protein